MLPAQSTLKILSYNIEGMKPGTDYQTRLQAIIQELKILDPDIMGFQEVAQHSASDNMAQTIADSLSLHFGETYNVYWQFTHTAYSSYSEGIGIVSKWPVVASGFQSLPIAVFPRKVLWNQIDIEGTPLHFFTSHLAYREEDNSARIQQVNSIKSYIESKVTITPGPVALTGDFNCTPDSYPIAQLGDYTSSWNLLHPSLSGYTYPATNPTKKIDYTFISNDFQADILHSSLKFFSTYDGTNYPSDHWGLMTTLQIHTSDIKSHDNRPTEMGLLTFPNPFNGSLTIRVDLQEQTDLSLEIFNLKGELKFHREDHGLSVGNHLFVWEPKANDTSGVYLCRISSATESLTQKLIMIK